MGVLDSAVVTELFDYLTEQKKYAEVVYKAFKSPEAREVLKQLIQEDEQIKKFELSQEQLEYAMQEMVGLKFLERIMKRYPDVTDISGNGDDIIVETNQLKEIYDEHINSSQVDEVIQRFADAAKKEFTEKEPILDAQIGYFRLNAVHKSLSPNDTCTFSIRVSRPKLVLTNENFSELADPYVFPLLQAAVLTRSNILIDGETGVGKTELQKLLLGMIPFKQKIIYIEDVPEGHVKQLYPKNKDIYSWLTSENTSITDLVKASLRNNPRWIIVSEVRGSEAYEMLQGVLSGHSIIGTLHAFNPEAIPSRFIHMAKMGYNLEEASLRQDIYAYFHFGIHLEKTEINGKTVRFIGKIIEFHSDETTTTLYERKEEDGKFYGFLGEPSEDFQKRVKKFHVPYEFFQNEAIL
ncbi:MAG: hypothetical protein K0Q87_167 [Neobacillus sp.]|jgi:pilus assembly protein CpaF|nr:hypothetical protein [Neobacillus sp.]